MRRSYAGSPRQTGAGAADRSIGRTSSILAQCPSIGRYVKSHRGPAAGSLTLTVYDTLGAFQALNIDVTVSEPPTVTINAAGEEVTGPMTVSSGTTIDCEVVASDPDGIGFPLFEGTGVGSIVPCSWDFGGAEIPHPFFSYSLQPPVTFVLEEGEPGRTFDLELTVYDGYGASTKRSVQVDVVP